MKLVSYKECIGIETIDRKYYINKFARAVGGNWSTDATWSTTSGGAADTVKPTASDDVKLDASSGQVTIDVASVAKSVDCTGYTNTLTHNAFVLTVSGSFTLVAGMTYTTAGATAGLTLNATGTLTTAAKTLPSLTFSGTNTFTFGDDITTNGDTTFSATGTYTTNSHTFTVSSVGVTRTFQGNGASLFNLTFIGNATKTSAINLSGNVTVTNILTVTGNSTTNRIQIKSSTIGTQRTITNTGATMTWQNCDFQDIGLSTSFNAAAITGNSGDCGGNTNITFTTPVTQTCTMSTNQNWSTSGIWTSRVPLPQDNVLLSSVTGGTLTGDMPRCGASIDWTGATGSPVWAQGSTALSMYGSLTLIAGMSVTGNLGLTLAGRSNNTITSAGLNLLSISSSLTIAAPGGTYTLQDALTVNGLFMNNGTFTANNFNVTANQFISQSNLTRAVNMGSGTWSSPIASTSPPWAFTSSAMTFSAGTSTILLTGVNPNSRQFQGGGLTYYNLQHTIANSAGTLEITGANSFNSINTGSGRQLKLPSSTVTTLTGGLTNNGVNNGFLYLPGFSGSNVTSVNASPLQILGDITIDAKLSLASWSAPTVGAIVSKWGGGTVKSWFLSLGSTGRLTWNTSSDGATNSFTIQSSTNPAFAAGATGWIRISWQADDGASHNVLKCYTSTDGVSWVQLGTTTTTAGATSLFNTTTGLEIGTSSGGVANLLPVSLYEVKIYNSYLQTAAGTPVLDADFTQKAFGANSFTESSTNAATMTINGVPAQNGDGRVSIVSSTGGTQATLTNNTGLQLAVDYFTIQDSTANGANPAYAGANSVNVSGNTGWLFQAQPFLAATGTFSFSGNLNFNSR